MVVFPPGKNPLIPGVATAVHENVAPPTSEVRITSAVVCPEQMDCDMGMLDTTGEGLTVITWVMAGPGHPPEVGMMV